MSSVLPLALVAALAADSNESHFVDVSLPVDGRLLASAFVDVDMDGRDEVVLAVRLDGGARELRVHALGADTLAREPRHVFKVPTDVIAWTVADVRAEAGREIVYLTRGGAFALSPTADRLRGNVARLIDAPLLYDVPDPLALPHWKYVVAAGGREWLLLPDRDGFALFAPVEGAAADAPWAARVRWDATATGDSSAAIGRANEGERGGTDGDSADGNRRGAGFDISLGSDLEPFLGESSTTTLASDGRAISAPALVDLDGDRVRDLVVLDGQELRVHLGNANGFAVAPSRVEKLPDYLRRGDNTATLELVDLDGDGRLDVLATWNEEFEGFENVEWRLLVLLGTKERLFPTEPNQVLRFEAANVSAEIGRIDGDALPDLVVRTFAVPSVVAAATGLTFEQTQLVYVGVRGGFERKPLFRQSRTFDENGVREVIANRVMRMDMSGDGLGDLVEVALDGKVAIKRLRKESGFFSGTTWQIDEAPWKSYATRGSVLSLDVRDLNGDGLGDVVSRAENGLTVLLSKKGGAR